MIWQSISLMTVVDILILGIVGYAGAVFFRDRQRPGRSSDSGFLAIFGGLSLVALFYLADLLVMHAFPSFMPRAEAMAIMREFHLNGNWLVALLGIGSICFGFTSVNRATVSLVGEIEARERDLVQELAERKQAEEALQKSESLFRAFVDNIPVHIMIRDTEGHFLFVNPSWEKYLERTSEQTIGKTVHEVYPKKAADLYMAQDRAMLETGRAVEQEAEGPAILGPEMIPDPKILHITRFPIRDAHGDITSIGVISIDITERRRAEAALRQSEARLKRAQEIAHIGTFVWDEMQDEAIYRSDVIADIYGLPPEQVPRSFEETIRIIHPDDRKWVREAFTAASKTGRPYDVEYRIVRPNGEIRYVHELSDLETDESEAFARSIGTLQDITERKRAEEALRESEARFRTLVEHAPEAITMLDVDTGLYVDANPMAETLHGLPRDELIGKLGLADLSPEIQLDGRPSSEAAPDYLSRALAGEFPRFEWMHLDPDGQETLCEVSLARLPDPHRNLVRASISDITERKAAEEQLRQAQKMEAVGQLTAGVAHDFNNMLAVILGNAELLEDELGADNPQLAAVVNATKRGAGLTQRLLAFSRKQVLNPEIINVNNLIADITELVRRTLEEHIDIETVTAAGLWNCEVDPAQLENALVNLAINARDAMPDGGKLTIETANARLDDDYAAAQAEVTPGQYVMLAVTDTGSGIPTEVREHVFEPFFTTKAVGAGSGLGLSMVYGFVKQSGGHVTIYSEQGEGTTIKLYLPRSTKTEVAEKKPVTDEVPVARGETVLVVEDDPNLRTLAVALLSGLGYQVMEAATGAAALEQLGSTTRVNLLLTDVVLPGGMNGRELATEIGRCAPGIKVLYMSGYTENAIAHHGRLDADAELMQKPFRRGDLARAVRNVLDGSST